MKNPVKEVMKLIQFIKSSNDTQAPILALHGFISTRVDQEAEKLLIMCLKHFIRKPKEHKNIKLISHAGKGMKIEFSKLLSELD